jgi:hypothetical protein
MLVEPWVGRSVAVVPAEPAGRRLVIRTGGQERRVQSAKPSNAAADVRAKISDVMSDVRQELRHRPPDQNPVVEAAPCRLVRVIKLGGRHLSLGPEEQLSMANVHADDKRRLGASGYERPFSDDQPHQDAALELVHPVILGDE